VHGEPLPGATFQHERTATRARDRTAVGSRDLRQPAAGDPRAVARGMDLSARLDAEVADARPHVLPLLADDVVAARPGAGPRAAAHRGRCDARSAARAAAGGQ